MKVKHNHQCNLTSNMTTCFVFNSEFSMNFALCRAAYDQLLDDYQFYPISDHYCSFCETSGGVKELTGFADSTFFSSVFLCHKCFHKIKDKINEQD